MSAWQSDFARHASGAAFHITVSGPMIATLALLAERSDPTYRYSGFNMAALGPLRRRGLVELIDHSTPRSGPFPRALDFELRVTPAGEHVVCLVKLAGLYPSAADRAAGGRG